MKNSMNKNAACDSDVACQLLDEVAGKIEKGFGDGAYDDKRFRKKVKSLRGQAIVPPDRNAVYKRALDSAMRQRDLDVAAIHILGGDEITRKIWKKLIGYHKRSLVETNFSRIKRILAPNLKARKFEDQKVGCQVKCLIMNKILSLGMPISEPVFKMAA